jgi:hypothetical protein
MAIKGEEDDCSEEFDFICGPSHRACNGRGTGPERGDAAGGHGGGAGQGTWQGRFGREQ